MKKLDDLSKVTEKVYPFAYALCGDDLLSYQLVVDGLSRGLHSGEIEESETVDIFSLKKVCCSIYSIAKKRGIHLGVLNNNRVGVERKETFYQLPLDQKAALFLNHKMKFESLDAAEIMGIKVSDYTRLLFEGREYLLKSKGKYLNI